MKQQLKELIKEEIRKLLNEYRDYSTSCINVYILQKVGISDKDIAYIQKVYNDIANKTGDEGSCVLGNGITINGKEVISSYSQGSIGLERIQQKIIPYLKKKYPKLKIEYNWGNMD